MPRPALSKQPRRLSPPRDRIALQNLVTSVMGIYTGPPVSSPPGEPAADISPGRCSADLPKPCHDTTLARGRSPQQWSPEMRFLEHQKTTTKTGALDCINKLLVISTGYYS